MRSVLENDEKVIEQGKLVAETINQGLKSFTPSTMFENLIQNYQTAKNIYGESIIRKVTGYEPNTVQKNIKLPEFQRELLSRMQERFQQLKDDDLMDRDGKLTERAIDLAAIVMYTEELDKIAPHGITGERLHKKPNPYGTKDEIKKFNKDRFTDIAIRKSIKNAIRRGHKELMIPDLVSHKRISKGERNIIYALDASGSMKGEKLEKCKKAGIALAFRAIEEKDNVGLIVFGTGLKATIRPSQNFRDMLKEITKTTASAQTDIAGTIREAVEMFPQDKSTKHLIIISDSIPTKGDAPESDTLKEAAVAAANGITISLIGISLEGKGKILAEKIVEIGNGRLYIAKDLKEIDKIVLMDYYST